MDFYPSATNYIIKSKKKKEEFIFGGFV